jgi:hypothetical protein
MRGSADCTPGLFDLQAASEAFERVVQNWRHASSPDAQYEPGLRSSWLTFSRGAKLGVLMWATTRMSTSAGSRCSAIWASSRAGNWSKVHCVTGSAVIL